MGVREQIPAAEYSQLRWASPAPP